MVEDVLVRESRASDPAAPENREIDRRNAPLRTEVQLLRGGVGNAAAFARSLSESVLYAVRWSEDELLTGDHEGVRWLYAFTSIGDLARFAVTRGADADAEVDFLTVRGDRLAEVALVELAARSGMPVGLALDVGGDAPMLVPSADLVTPVPAPADVAPEGA